MSVLLFDRWIDFFFIDSKLLSSGYQKNIDYLLYDYK